MKKNSLIIFKWPNYLNKYLISKFSNFYNVESLYLTDYKKELIVVYNGAIPNLFSEERGAVVEGKLNDKSYLIADRILAKHDENYMPPEMKKILENAK